MQIYYDNAIFKGTLTASSYIPGFPVENLQNRSREIPLIFFGKTDENVVLDAGSGNTFTTDAIALFNFNFTSSITITLQGNATDNWGSPSFNQSITYRAGEIAETFTSQTYRFFRIRFQDGTNPNNLQVGIGCLGKKVDVAYLDPGFQLNKPTTTKQSFTRSGQIRGVKKRNYFSESFRLNNVTESKRQELLAVWKEVMNVDTFIFIVWENSFDVQSPLYAVFSMGEFAFKKDKFEGLTYTSNIKIREVF
jgi:hypothetical protein